ncbi:hypothetical protein CN307_27750 [Bacillus cereus]|uniref:Uncharacterized protein n=1 Tax=Bacillus cereus TaxID=1396 RepID=A0A2A8ZUX0_BACCE|nr:hypothetical protein CN307_27750 [Bacillus cereus]
MTHYATSDLRFYIKTFSFRSYMFFAKVYHYKLLSEQFSRSDIVILVAGDKDGDGKKKKLAYLKAYPSSYYFTL